VGLFALTQLSLAVWLLSMIRCAKGLDATNCQVLAHFAGDVLRLDKEEDGVCKDGSGHGWHCKCEDGSWPVRGHRT
jgi:hypothetical protein